MNVVGVRSPSDDPTPPPRLAVRVVIAKVVGAWTYEPRDRYNRAAWPFALAWNRQSPPFLKRTGAETAARLAFPGLKIEADDAPAVETLEEVESTEEAIARADTAAPDAWKAAADRVIAALAASRKTFTADEVWRGLAQAGHAQPPEPRALGGRLQAAARGRDPIIVSTGMTTKSTRPEAHGSFVTVWRSKVATRAAV